LLLINEGGEFRLRRFDPRAGVFRAARILSDRDDFKIPDPKFFVEELPAWQVEAAASP